MNYRGSYRHLLKNARAAMTGAIEIYNKPRFEYRDECFIILLLNAWELALKALISKKGKSIYYPKKRKEPYKTLSLRDSFSRAEKFFPNNLPTLPIRRNIELLATYRDNAVHFYNESKFGLLIYALAQTSIINFKDLLGEAFGIDLEEEISWHLMPMGIQPPIDPIEYISGNSDKGKKPGAAVQQFIAELARSVKEVEDANEDTGKLLTVFKVNLQSTKKIQRADVVVGVGASTEAEGPLLVERSVDPNLSHPLRQKDVIRRVDSLHGRKLNNYLFQAIAWRFDLKNKSHLCWRASEGVLTKYSNEVPAWFCRLSASDCDTALAEYRASMARKRKERKACSL